MSEYTVARQGFQDVGFPPAPSSVIVKVFRLSQLCPLMLIWVGLGLMGDGC